MIKTINKHAIIITTTIKKNEKEQWQQNEEGQSEPGAISTAVISLLFYIHCCSHRQQQ